MAASLREVLTGFLPPKDQAMARSAAQFVLHVMQGFQPLRELVEDVGHRGYRALISSELARHQLVPMEGKRGALARNRRSGEKPGCANVARNPDGRSRYTLEDQSRESATNPFSPP